MLAVVHAVVREEEKGPSCMTVWDVFHVLSFFRVRSEYKKAIKKNLESGIPFARDCTEA